jgi:hypothetical protein
LPGWVSEAPVLKSSSDYRVGLLGR